jgi:uncharacterized protein
VYLFMVGLCLAQGIEAKEPKKTMLSLTIQGKKILVDVARSEEEKSRGLMFREKLGKNEGMLFVYGEEEFLSFWMKNTPLPLSIAFINKSGRIVDIQDMEPFSLKTHVSASPAQFALEVNQGWFKQNDIGIGTAVKLPSNIGK